MGVVLVGGAKRIRASKFCHITSLYEFYSSVLTGVVQLHSFDNRHRYNRQIK